MSSFFPAMVYPAAIIAARRTAAAADRYCISIVVLVVPKSDMMITPRNESVMPRIIFGVSFSFKKMAARSATKMGMVAMMRLAALAEMYCSP